MFAPNHHAAMKHAAPVRRELGVRTIFNILGPLTNPAGAPNILMGVFHPDLVGIQVRVLQRLGAQHAMVVWGRDNMDEVSLGAATMVGELVNGEIREYEIHPEDFGLQMIASRNLKVADAEESKAKGAGSAGRRAGPGARHRRAQCRHRAVCGWPGRRSSGPAWRQRARRWRPARRGPSWTVRQRDKKNRRRLTTGAHTANRTSRQTMSDILNKILAVKADEVAAAKKYRSLPACAARSRATAKRATACADSKAACAARSRRAGPA